MKVKNGKARLNFDYVAGGLVAKDGPLRQFTIAGADSVFVPAQAKIEGKSVVVWSDQVRQPVAARFAWREVPKPNFFNAAGLPAAPFRTDKWRMATQGKLWRYLAFAREGGATKFVLLIVVCTAASFASGEGSRSSALIRPTTKDKVNRYISKARRSSRSFIRGN
ncbi:hypothetical protein [Hymenobacter cavernae]|uniref:Uncharacterized protein n=1 Tax=Hymenobacter cavernae TaxID=2044852 RepID=A0ABQ1TRR6_9BACT|nr:hypothetical protein [Hymenobacter cavernae]GGE99497.1 hypothetical protein GCM10011383_07900 [Hymenobacter cavernae]